MREPRYIDLNEAFTVLLNAIDDELIKEDWNPGIEHGLSQAIDLLLTVPIVQVSELQKED